MTHSSFVGNGRASGANCGVLNGAGQQVRATGNDWGAATGPGADPADDVCNWGAGSTTTSPFNTGEIEIRPRPLR